MAPCKLDAAPNGRAEASNGAAFLRGLGDRVRTLRARRGMTRKLLAIQSGVSERYIAQMETGSGNASVLLLRAVADALGVSAADLLAAENDDAALLQSMLLRLTEQQSREARALLAAHFALAGTGARRARVALIGLRGAGKSTLGTMLAHHRGVAFVELDREIERAAGLPIGDLVEQQGQAGYRRQVRAALERLLDAHPAMVLEAGGSIVAEPSTFEVLLARCLVVWVRTTPEQHMARVVAQGDLRPIADSRAAMADLRAILSSRESLYAKADYVIDTSAVSVAESFRRLDELTT